MGEETKVQSYSLLHHYTGLLLREETWQVVQLKLFFVFIGTIDE